MKKEMTLRKGIALIVLCIFTGLYSINTVKKIGYYFFRVTFPWYTIFTLYTIFVVMFWIYEPYDIQPQSIKTKELSPLEGGVG